MTDLIGHELKVDDFVAATCQHYIELQICKVTKITPKGCKVRPLVQSGYKPLKEEQKFGGQVVWVDPQYVLIHVLQS